MKHSLSNELSPQPTLQSTLTAGHDPNKEMLRRVEMVARTSEYGL